MGSSAVAAPVPAVGGDKVGAAAQALADKSYPFLKSIDWSSDLYLKPLPGVSAEKALKAAASAHHQAIGSIDATGVTSVADYASVTAALGRAIASAPTSKVMDVYNAFAGILQPSVPNTLFSKVDPLAANAAASAFYEFKDVVKAALRETPRDGLRAGRDRGRGGFELMGGLCHS